MKELVLFLCLIQLSSSCSCVWDEPNPDLFCNNPSYNAVKVRVEKITKDLPDRHAIYEAQEREMEQVREQEYAEIMQKLAKYFDGDRDWEEDPPTEPPTSDVEWLTWSEIDYIWLNSDREVEAVVEKVWGLGNAKVGQKMTLSSLNDEARCGAARFLMPGMTRIIWKRQDMTTSKEWLCGMFLDPSSEEYLDLMDVSKC